MAILVKPRSESAHWYSANGEPVHTRPNADGKGEHPTTLMDARKLTLFPSSTNVLGVLAKHGLEKWKIRQVWLAMTKSPQKKGEPREVYYDRILNEAFEQVDRAQTGGTGIHKAILHALQGREVIPEYRAYIDPIFDFFKKNQIVPHATEQNIVNHEHGFAGTMDLAAFWGEYPAVFDWKTRKTEKGKPILSYEVQPMQIASYAGTYWRSRWPAVFGGNIYISSTEPGRIEMIRYDPNRMDREWKAFLWCLAIWRHIKGYDPRTAGSVIEMTESNLAAERHQAIIISSPGPDFKLLTSLDDQGREGVSEQRPPIPQTEGRPKGKAPKAKVNGTRPGKKPREPLTHKSLRFRSLPNLLSLSKQNDLSKEEKKLVAEYIGLREKKANKKGKTKK